MAMRTSGRSTSNLRRVPRCPLSVPVRITLRNAGGVQGIPGRSLDLGEGGIAAILAGAVNPGDSVAVEFFDDPALDASHAGETLLFDFCCSSHCAAD